MTQDERPHSSFWTSKTGLAFLVFAAIGTYYLMVEHRSHLFAALPYLLLLACPLMHVFMHGKGHGGGSHEHEGRKP